MATGKSFYIGYGLVFNITALFGGVTLYLNDKLRADMNKIYEEKIVKEHMKKIHSNLAPRYDKFYSRVEVRNKINYYRKILASYCEGDILETGCGTGRNFFSYKKNSNVVAIDYCQEMLEQANQKILEKKVSKGTDGEIEANISLSSVDCENLVSEFGENKFTTTIDIMNMHSYADPEKVFDQIKKVTKNNGKIIIMARGKSDNFLINFFYDIFKPTIFMRYGCDYSRNWDDFFLNKENNKIPDNCEIKCLYHERKNFGKTYLYIFEIQKH